jgi:hypothetical protein
MKHKKLILGLFVLVAIAQLYLPYNLISKQSEETMAGNTFHFRIRHIRPESLERGNMGTSIQGKYIWLQFEENRFKPADRKEWEKNGPAWVTLATDSLGFAEIESVSRTKPSGTPDYVKARTWIDFRDSSYMVLMYPFRNYYIADDNTDDIKTALTRTFKDTLSTNYLSVKISNGQYISDDLVIDSLSFKDFVNKTREKK